MPDGPVSRHRIIDNLDAPSIVRFVVVLVFALIQYMNKVPGERGTAPCLRTVLAVVKSSEAIFPICTP